MAWWRDYSWISCGPTGEVQLAARRSQSGHLAETFCSEVHLKLTDQVWWTRFPALTHSDYVGEIDEKEIAQEKRNDYDCVAIGAVGV